MREDELARRRLRAARTGRGAGEREAERVVDLDPRSAYELLTRQMVGDLGEELREIPSDTAENCPARAPNLP